MNTELWGIIGAVAGIGIPAVMSLVGWLWTSRERDARHLLDATNKAQQKELDTLKDRLSDHEKRLRDQESGEAIKELRQELRDDFQRLSQTVTQLGVTMQQAMATYAQSAAAVQGELAGMREVHRLGDPPSFGKLPTNPGGGRRG